MTVMRELVERGAAAEARGVLHLVVGPSGAGKDTLMQAALAERRDIAAPARVVTRPSDAGGESHVAMSPEAFALAEARGVFCLSWRAHGLAYGVPKAVIGLLDKPRHVIVGVSRGAVEAARRLAPVRVLLVTAPIEILAERLATRGRESAAVIAERLRRAEAADPFGPDVTRIENAGSVADGAAALRAALAPPLRLRHERPEPERAEQARAEPELGEPALAQPLRAELRRARSA